MFSADPTPAMFQILLALADGDRHGYGILREVEARTGGEFRLGPGTLYRSLGRLLDAGLIQEVQADGRQKPYRITAAGRRRLRDEARHLARTLDQVQAKNVLGDAGS